MIALDASALLAFLLRERGHRRVQDLLGDACMSTVNLSEALGRFARAGQDATLIAARLKASRIEWVPFSETHAVLAAGLVPATRPAGLSFGDRACLALASERGIRALTADAAWRKLALDIEVELIR